MARDAKIIQRGMDVQGNDLALPAGTPVYALNADFSREGVAQRRVGFEQFWDGLPQGDVINQLNGYNHYGKFHELFSKTHLFMPFSGMMFTYDTAGADQWYSVPVNLPHRMQTLYSDVTLNVQTLGRAPILTFNDTVQWPGKSAWNWQTPGNEYRVIHGAVGNDASQATDATAVQNAKFSTAFDAVQTSSAGTVTIYISDDTSIRATANYTNTEFTVLAGSITVAGSTDGTTTAARFSGASWMASNGTDTVYVADNVNQIRKVTSAGVVTTLAGSITAGDTDGVGTAARFRNISGLAYSSGFLYVAEGVAAHRIRKVDVTTGSVTIFAGALTPTSGYVDANGTSARFNTPIGLEYSGGFLYTGDTSNNAVRQISTTSPFPVITFAGGTGKATASASVGLVGGAGDAAQMPSVTVRSQYENFPVSAGTRGHWLCLECTAPNSSTDLGLLYIGNGTYSGDTCQVWHYARTPNSLPTATTGPVKLDTVGPDAYTTQDVRSADIGSGAVFTTSEKPRVLDVYSRLNSIDAFPRLRPLGIEAPEVPSVTTTTGSTFATLTAAAYRTLCGLKLPDGRVILGPPSPRVVLTNATGGALAGSVTAYPSQGLPYDGMAFIQAYRTRTVASTVDPGDQMFLCYEAPLTYGQGVVFTDITPDDLLGAELSTNQTQDGFAYAPLPPPLFANEVCEFNNSCVLANYNERASVRVKLLGVSSIVNGTSTVTFTTTGPSTATADPCQTLTLTAGTVTSVATKVFGVTTGGSAATNAVATAKEIVRVINRNPDAMMFSAVYDDNDPGAFVVYSWSPGRSKDSVFQIYNAGYVNTNVQAQVTFSTTATANLIAISQVPSQRELNAIAYSDTFTPDAFPVVNTRLLSASQEPILRLLPIAENLIAVKASSVWRYDQSFTEQIYDTSLSTDYPDSFARLNNAWIGLFSCGFAQLSASQATKVGRQIERMTLPLLRSGTLAYGATVEERTAYVCTVKTDLEIDTWRTFAYYANARAWSEWSISQAAETTEMFGVGIPGSFQGSFLANVSPPSGEVRGVLRGRDNRRSSSTNTPVDYSDAAVVLTNVVVSGTSFVGSFTQASNMIETAPDASTLVGGWLTPNLVGVVVASATISGTSVSGSVTISGAVTDTGTMSLYSPINFGVLYAPVFAPANSQFGDVVVTLERIRGASITCEFFNRYDAAYPYSGVYARAPLYNGPYYPAIYTRTNTMLPADVPGGTSANAIGAFLEDVQRFATPIERSTDQTLTVGVFEQKGAAPMAIKGVTIDYVSNDKGKVKQ